MSRTQKHHHELNENGTGKCSVPMYSNGVPAGFCDENAFGVQTKEYLARFPAHLLKYNQPAYAPGLACVGHGGIKCPDIDLGDGNFSGCNPGQEDCPACGE